VREGLVDIDGSRGEGGGQILRTSLALSIVTGRPMRMRNIRAGRAKGGLRRQHLACVEAAAKLCGAALTGATLGSQSLEFTPATAWADEVAIDIGTAGSTSLVVQTILVPAIVSGRPLHATVIGGTHNPKAPPFDFLDRVFVPHLRAMGASVTLTLDRHGFAVGSSGRDSHDTASEHRGQLTLTIEVGVPLRPIEVLEAGPVLVRRATAIVAGLPQHIAGRELVVVRDRLGWKSVDCEIRELATGGPANVLLLEVERAGGRELVTVFGEKGLPAERVADRACDELTAFLDANIPVGEHLADQLLLPMALAGGGSFRSAPLSRHATTNIETIELFLDIGFRVEPDGDAVVVTVG
jgi:RNA 3'-terminal phosphate cyclase (ATP)